MPARAWGFRVLAAGLAACAVIPGDRTKVGFDYRPIG